MSYTLNKDKQVAAISALAEGSSIRSVERMTGIHRDTIMRLGVRIGGACASLLDRSMRDLNCRHIEVDEIWGFIGKKDGHAEPAERKQGMGDVWTFIAEDKETKIVPCFHVGKRTGYDATVFMEDLSSRMKNRIQLSSDAMVAYVDAVERGFGCEIDYGQIVKVFRASELGQRRYSPPSIWAAERKIITGNPREKICTSHIESQNLTVRMHCRRLTRLTNAFSKKIENFKAAIGLHFAYYNFCKRHCTLRMTPAMAAGVAHNQWEVADLVDLAVGA